MHLKKEINKAHWLKQTLKIPEYDYGLIFGSLRYLLYQAIVSYIMWFLAEEWSVSGSKRVVFLLPVIVFYIIGLLTAGKFTGPKKTNLVFVVLGFSLICLGSAAIFYISESRNSLLLISMLAVVSLGFGFAHNTLTTAMVGNLPEDNKGSALGFAMTVNYACIIVAPLMMSESAARWGPAVPFMVVAVFSLVVSFLALLFGLKFLLRVEG